MSVKIEPIEASGLRNQVLEAIERALLSGALQPGDRVVEADIAREAGISRGPVREAIQHLVAQGILTHSPNRGTFVTRWTENDVYETYSLRALLESYAVRLAMASITPAVLAELEQLLETMCQRAHAGDALGVYHHDVQFHHHLYELAGHRLLSQMVYQLERRIYMLISLDAATTHNLVQYADNHEQLLQVLRSGDPDLAETVFREHILQVGRALVQRMREQGARAEAAAERRAAAAPFTFEGRPR
jgi:DNA-binding GntR family transcriptional regulator